MSQKPNKTSKPAALLAPRIEFSISPGDTHPHAAHITLKAGRAAKTIQPNPKHLVFFHLGAAEELLGISLFEPVLGVPISYVVERLVCAKDGSPSGVKPGKQHLFLTADDILRALKILEEALDKAKGGIAYAGACAHVE